MSEIELLGILSDISLPAEIRNLLVSDLEKSPPPSADAVADRILDRYGIDLTSQYASVKIPHPFGKGAGQLSLHESHVKSDMESGLAFTILKSAVGVTGSGEVGIEDWQRSAPKMVVEKRRARDGRDGWTVTWKGRGWDRGFGAYLDLYRKSLEGNPGYPAIPSLMVDVTNPERAIEQGEYCIGKLADIHESLSPDREFLIEIDISPTLSLLPNSDDENIYRGWLKTSVAAFREGLQVRGRSVVKLPNAGKGASLQVGLAKDALEEGRGSVAGLIAANRLFDRDGVFEGQKGIAYGGWDLSNANLEALDRLINEGVETPLIGTGNICSGRMMAEYALRGCASGQIHTFFQLPPDACRAPVGQGGRVWRALRELLFHPDDGLVAICIKLEQSGKLNRTDGLLKYHQLASLHRSLSADRVE